MGHGRGSTPCCASDCEFVRVGTLSLGAGIVDSQSANTTGVGGEQRGYDGGVKVRGRKRHLLVDTEGLVLKAKVHSAKVPDQDGLRLLLESARSAVSGLKHLWLGRACPPPCRSALLPAP